MVAPLVGAWIEIILATRSWSLKNVAPLVGAWIEILKNQGMQNLFAESHPSWVRGLKSERRKKEFTILGSHPSWVRGLKWRV